jgi:hypothetical protein
MYAAHLLPSSGAATNTIHPSIHGPSEPAVAVYVSEYSAWIELGTRTPMYDRERPVRVDRMGYASDPSPLLAGRIGRHPSMVHPSTHRKTTAPGGEVVTATAGRSRTHAGRRDDDKAGRAGPVRYGIPLTMQARAIPNSPNHPPRM